MKNRLLLAMSTLPSRGMERIDFKVDGGDIQEVKDCISQLEPITKLMLKKHENEKIEIVMLCTKDTIENHQYYHCVGDSYTRAKENDALAVCYTAADFFMNRIMDYLHLSVNELICTDENEIVTYSTAEEKISFVIILIDEYKPQIGIV